MFSKIKQVAKGASIGILGGTILGTIMVPNQILMALTAPVSYPLVGGVMGCLHNEMPTRLTSTLFGIGVGTALIPIAPLSFLCAPFAPVTYGFLGGVAGGVVAYVESK